MEGFLKPEWLTKGFNDLKGCNAPNQYCYTKQLELTCNCLALSPGQYWLFLGGCHYYAINCSCLAVNGEGPLFTLWCSLMQWEGLLICHLILYLADCAASYLNSNYLIAFTIHLYRSSLIIKFNLLRPYNFPYYECFL